MTPDLDALAAMAAHPPGGTTPYRLPPTAPVEAWRVVRWYVDPYDRTMSYTVLLTTPCAWWARLFATLYAFTHEWAIVDVQVRRRPGRTGEAVECGRPAGWTPAPGGA